MESKEVKISLKGLHGIGDEKDNIEVIAIGEMYEKDGYTCVDFEEVTDENETGVVQVINNTLKIKDGQIEIIKEGFAASHMVFVPGKTTYTYYSTPMGELEVGLHTKDVEKFSKENNTMGLILDYDLEMNHVFVSNCTINIEIRE